MSSAVSKRQQARNERALQELIHTVPGNDQCADCQARNPGWASWNLGIFICMRCASLHRKLGTHISKVKSLSMDAWTSEQVETMKRNGNVQVNKTYNPKNIRPDIPVDADEVDSAMERFIRKKYQERSLSTGKPRVPSRNESRAENTPSSPVEDSQPPPLPSKKGKLFGFGLRASSSAFPLSKADKKKLPIEPTFESAYGIASSDYNRQPPNANPSHTLNSIMSDAELRQKLDSLKEMGFRNENRNSLALKAYNGNVERVVASLIRHEKDKEKAASKVQPLTEDATKQTPSATSIGSGQRSNNPFETSTTGAHVGLSFSPPDSQRATPLNAATGSTANVGSNPFGVSLAQSQPMQGLQQGLQGLQISQPLFPHSTGGYPTQTQPIHDVRFQHSITPPIPLVSQQYGLVASPPAMTGNTNPFFQSTQQAQLPKANPYAAAVRPQALTSNPFLNQTSATASTPPVPQSIPVQAGQPASSTLNPFGLPPADVQALPTQRVQQQNIQQSAQSSFNQSRDSFPPNINGNFATTYAQQQTPNPFYGVKSQSTTQPPLTIPNPFMNPAPPPQQPQSFQSIPIPPQPQLPVQPQITNPYQQPQQLAYQQPTGRIDKSSILALYSYPQLAPQRPSLPSIPEPTESPAAGASPAPFSSEHVATTSPARRSVTMPVLSSSSDLTTQSRNPFLKQGAGGNLALSPGVVNGVPGQSIAQHSSRESVAILGLENGRHSPDAFANLSARFA